MSGNSKLLNLVIGILTGFVISLLLGHLSFPCITINNQEHRSMNTKLYKTFTSYLNFNLEGYQKYFTTPNILLLDSTESALENNVLQKPDSTVNPQRKLIFIGVMTAHKFLHTRAVAVYNTWGQGFPGKIMFFTGAKQSMNSSEDEIPLPEIPIVTLPGVDDTYPPQKKSFMMLKYIAENYGDEYEWFLRADDDLYVRTEKLTNFLRSLNSQQFYFIGQAGRGSRQELGTLNLAHNENFCMGGPGIIFSQATLRKMAPHVFECLENMYTTHEDVEIGRCVHRFARISCTWAYDMQSFFYHNSSGENAFTGSLKHNRVNQAITLHPIKHHSYIYRLHAYFNGKEIEKRFLQVIQLQRELFFASSLLNSSLNVRDSGLITEFDQYNITGLPPSLRKFIPTDWSEIPKWRFITNFGFNSPNELNPKQAIDSASREGVHDVIRELMETINSISKVRGRVIEFKELLYGYHRVDPLHGEDFVLDILLTYKKFRGRKMTVPVRRHAYIQRPFGPLQLRISPNQELQDPVRLVFVVTLQGRFSTFDRFLQNYRFVCNDFMDEVIQKKIEIQLIIVYFGGETENKESLDLVASFQHEALSPIKLIQADGKFSRSIGLEIGISQCRDEDLLFIIDVDIVFSPEAIHRILTNAKRGSQVFFPIVFSEYSNDLFSDELKAATSFKIGSDRGYWREFGFGIAAFYKSDFLTTGGYDVSIQGWGNEDVVLFEKFLKTDLTVLRAPEPELIHIYHPIYCDPKISQVQLTMCIGSQASTLGSVKSLLRFILTNQRNHSNLNELSKFLFH